MIRHEIAQLVREAVERAEEAGEIPLLALPEFVVERPQRPEHGDYATNLPLRLARPARANPLTLAHTLARHIQPTEAISEVTAAPPGFLNFRLSEQWLARQVETILTEGKRFGCVNIGEGRKVQVEFVSANPTGPLTIGNGRGASLGSALAAVLAAAGYQVEREYYINDAGTQTDTFARTLYARYLQLFGRDVAIPPDGYPGAYMIELAEQIREEVGERFLGSEDAPPPAGLRELGIRKMVEHIRDDLRAMRVEYDVWFSESSLYEPRNGRPSLYETVMALLREHGYLMEKEGALWFTSSNLGEDKDNVLVRTSGAPTYFASDIAYHYNKFIERGFDRVIDIWGADHQGHVSRMKAAAAAIGVDPSRLDILIYQLVTVRRGKEIVRLSKRAGEIITLREIIEEIGTDAARFFLISRSADAQMDLDLELAQRQSAENPVYYVQYAHARIAGILMHAAERRLDYVDGDVRLLRHPAELALIRKMLQLPELVETMATALEPHHLPYYAIDLATAFHAFYTECRVVGDDIPLSKARLKLVAAAKTVLANTLGLMSVSAPERM